MKLIDIRIGTEYIHDDIGHCLVVGIHPQDPSAWIIQVFDEDGEYFDITESKFLQPMTTH